MKNKQKIGSLTGIILIILLFILISFLVQNNIDFLRSYIENNFLSMFIYVLIMVLLTIIAPINDLLIVPIASAFWGWLISALLTLLGWAIGASIIFFVSRKYGVPLIKKIISLDKIYEYEEFMPKHHKFIGMILLRLAIPIDLMHYAISLFTRIKFWPYLLATVIGLAPLAFIVGYLGTLPTYIQIIGFIILLIVIFLGIIYFRLKHNEMKGGKIKNGKERNNKKGEQRKLLQS